MDSPALQGDSCTCSRTISVLSSVTSSARPPSTARWVSRRSRSFLPKTVRARYGSSAPARWSWSCSGTPLQLGFRHLALRTDDIDATLDTLRAAGIVPEDLEIRRVPTGFSLLFFSDPDGLEIEIMQEG
jgi:catechol 2,3-dioxygenase-like lactoylglutathione lyase family enzyme